MRRQLIVNRLTKYCRLGQGRKFKRPRHRLWRRVSQQANKPNHRRSWKPWERSPRPFNQQLGRVAPFATHLRRQSQRARCARRAASSGASLFAEFWGEFSVAAAAAADRTCSHGPMGRIACRTATRLQKKTPGAKRPAILFAFDYFFLGPPAGLAPSFFPPLPAFTSTSVADIV